jgi:hypothetical protein
MTKPPDAFRNFGILPQAGMPPPPETVRCFFSGGRIFGQYLATGLVSALGLGLAVLLALLTPLPLNLLGCAAMLVGFGSFVYLATHNDYRWVELDGTTLRAKHLYTGRVIERSLEDVACLLTMVRPIRRTETIVVEAIWGRVKGVEIRFRDRRTPMRIQRADPAMMNARELIEAVLFRMAQIRELDAEIVNFAGRPLVRSVHWKDDKPPAPSSKTLKLCLACLTFLALLFGGICAFWDAQVQRLRTLGAVPPQMIALRTLIENGPGSNQHVMLTDFQFGGCSYLTDNNSPSWSSVWIALFPAGEAEGRPADAAAGPREIRAVLVSRTIPDAVALRQYVKQGRIVGICSASPTGWGGTMKAELLKANAGCQLSSAWEIEELSEPPSEAAVRNIFLASAACFALVFALGIIIYKIS